MDLASLAALVVAVLIVVSGYFLFNDVPRPRGNHSPRRR